MIVILLVVLLLSLIGVSLWTTGGTMTTGASGSATDNVMIENAPPITHHIEPTDPRTWPSGDRIWNCCRAIAIAEGYNVLVDGQPSNPSRLNNPGDISDGYGKFGGEYHSGSNITKFPDAQTGWSWLYSKIENAASGNSSVYDPSFSWREIGAKWAPPNAETWAANVAGALGVDPDSSLSDYVNG